MRERIIGINVHGIIIKVSIITDETNSVILGQAHLFEAVVIQSDQVEFKS